MLFVTAYFVMNVTDFQILFENEASFSILNTGALTSFHYLSNYVKIRELSSKNPNEEIQFAVENCPSDYADVVREICDSRNRLCLLPYNTQNSTFIYAKDVSRLFVTLSLDWLPSVFF